MSSDTKFLFGMIGSLSLIVAGIFILAASLDRASCHSRFAGSSLKSDWSLLGGCRVLTPDQGWIPATNYRVL